MPTGVRVFVEAPSEVRLGEQFEIQARVENLSPTSIRLVSIDIADSYLEGIAIDSMYPRFSELFHVPIDNTMSYTLNATVERDSNLTVRIQATAEQSGPFGGDFDFCINSSYSFLSFYVRTRVAE